MCIRDRPKETQTEQTPKRSVSANYTQYNTYRPGTVSYKFNHESQEHHFYIPEKVLECFNDEFDYCLLYTSKMCDNAPDYKKRSYGRKQTVLYYTTNEILGKYQIQKKTLYRRCKLYKDVYKRQNLFRVIIA